MESLKDFEAEANPQPELQWLSLVGRGSFSMLFLAHQASSEQQVAVELFQEDLSNPLDTRWAKREVCIIQLLRHQNIIELLEVSPLLGVGAG